MILNACYGDVPQMVIPKVSTYSNQYHIIILIYIFANSLQYIGDLSIRHNETCRPLMMIGQDESTFRQYIFSPKTWRGQAGFNQILPKSIDEIAMTSGFQSKGFGLSLGNLLTEERFPEIDYSRVG